LLLLLLLLVLWLFRPSPDSDVDSELEFINKPGMESASFTTRSLYKRSCSDCRVSISGVTMDIVFLLRGVVLILLL